MNKLTTSLRSTAFVLGAVWIIFLFQKLRWISAQRWGIVPRDGRFLSGILAAPFLHADWAHLLANSVPLAVMGWMLFYFYQRMAWLSFGLIHLLTGTAVWLLARGNAVHIGASGVVYGLAGFVLGNGVFRRDFKSIGLLLVVAGLYSGLIYGILPTQPGVSWESHLFGAGVGLVVAYQLRRLAASPPMSEPILRESGPDLSHTVPAVPSRPSDRSSSDFERALQAEFEKSPKDPKLPLD